MKNKPSIIEVADTLATFNNAVVRIANSKESEQFKLDHVAKYTYDLKNKLDAWGIGQQIDWNKSE